MRLVCLLLVSAAVFLATGGLGPLPGWIVSLNWACAAVNGLLVLTGAEEEEE